MSMQIAQMPGDIPVAQVAVPRPVASAAAAAVQQESAQQAQQPSAEQVKKAVENLKQATQSTAQNLQFSVDHDTNQTVIRVVDGNTNEVIRQIPSEEVLQIAKSLDKLSGLLLKQKA
jgi:flagellar protein FlaG